MCSTRTRAIHSNCMLARRLAHTEHAQKQRTSLKIIDIIRVISMPYMCTVYLPNLECCQLADAIYCRTTRTMCYICNNGRAQVCQQSYAFVYTRCISFACARARALALVCSERAAISYCCCLPIAELCMLNKLMIVPTEH